MLLFPPTFSHLSRIYYELSLLGAKCVGKKTKWPYEKLSFEQLLILACEMSRYDPRLFDILVEYFYFHWNKLNPYLLRGEIKNMQEAAIIGVISSFAKQALNNQEAIYFFDYLVYGIKAASYQLFFINLYPPASRLMQKASEAPLEQFYQWGFLARERPIIHDTKRIVLGYWEFYARQNIIRNLVDKKQVITIADYLSEVDHTISRQQALIDLQKCPFVKSQGKGRGSYWCLSA